MIYALWEILIPLLLAFVLGIIVGWFIWRWRRTEVTASEWDALQARADRGDRAGQQPVGLAEARQADEARITALTADVEVRDIEIEQLRAANAHHHATIARAEAAGFRLDPNQPES